MYFPVGWPKQLGLAADCSDENSRLVHVSTNRERLLFCVLTEGALNIWYCKPAVQIVCVKRSVSDIDQYGNNEKAEWKPDSSMLAVTTTKGYILFYKVEMDTEVANAALFVQKEEKRSGGKKEVVTIGDGESIPALKLRQTSYIQVLGNIICMVCLREELMVSTGVGMLQRIKWDGSLVGDMTIHLTAIPFSTDLQHSRAFQLTEADVHVANIQYSPLMGGFAVVLSNGRAAFITASSLKFEPKQVVGVWAQDISHTTCVAINHKYMLMAFGCDNGEGIVYNLDETTGALQISHRLVVSSKDFPDASNSCGSVCEIKWTPDGCALAMAWKKGGFSLWSVFGSLLVCSATTQSSMSDCLLTHPVLYIAAMEWGSEGYHLWIVSNSGKLVRNGSLNELLQLYFVKSALAVNPCTANHGHLFLQGEDKLYLCTEETIPTWMTGSQPGSDDYAMIGNKQWQIVPIPHTYLAHNWPIRYAAVNVAGHCVAVAGKTGLAHYALYNRRWKLFGNESQERDMVVTGGLTWWKDFVCTACYNLQDQKDEIRFYPRDTKLDNTFAIVVRVPSQIMLLNTFHNILIALCADCHIMIFRLERRSTQTSPTVGIMKVQEVAVGNFIPHPATVVALTLTSLRTETAATRVQPQKHEVESIILNVGGRLLLFQRDRSGPQLKDNDTKERLLPFCAPVMVASSVENMWSSSHPSNRKPHLTEALWLGCGATGMKVWLPLHPLQEEVKTKGFMSRRIMLPFRVDIYPLAILFEGGIILGATSDSTTYHSTYAAERTCPYLQLERTSQVHLHHILRQLLRRNLGVHALEIARSCIDLPYFPHVLELLLHEVLEEEATSKEPIPDPLLPRVVAFVQEFPEYLQTVVHCARKTEVALWQYLFTTVGNPKDLFEECLVSERLDVAAAYLIILQNLEKPIISRQHATLLLDSALEHNKWDLARDLVRFLKAIDPDEAESPHTGLRSRLSSSVVYPGSYPTVTPPVSPTGNDSQGYSAYNIHPMSIRGRSVSLHEDDVKENMLKRTKDNAKIKDKPKLVRSDSQPHPRMRHNTGGSRDGKEDATAEMFFIDVILHRHARKLLSSYRLRDLACFAANLEDYQLVSWLRRERVRAARVEDFEIALKKLHEDFLWPLPIMTLYTLHTMTTGNISCNTDDSKSPTQARAIPHSASLNLLDDELNGPSNGTNGSYYYDSLNPAALLPSGFATISTPNDEGSMSLDNSVSSPNSAEILLQPQISMDEISLTPTDTSDNSSTHGDPDMSDSNGPADALCLSELERVSQELANKGPTQSEHELRYLFQILLEAGCLEWAMLIAIILRDNMAVIRIVNTASLTDTPIEIVARMREGISLLERWANTECFGYRPFLHVIQPQILILAKLVQQDPPVSRYTLPTRLSTSSNESSHENDYLDLSNVSLRDVEGATVNNKSQEQDSYECSIS